MTIEELEIEALKLDLTSRAKLASKLLQSLDELSEAVNERLWAEEALRRNEEMEKGVVEGRPAEDVMREARARLG
jgi:hypothetical protein